VGDSPLNGNYKFKCSKYIDYVKSVNGYIWIVDCPIHRVVICSCLPSTIGVINKVSLADQGKIITLESNRGIFIYRDGWCLKSEQIESLISNNDQKVIAQCSKLENEIAAAIETENFDQFSVLTKQYVLYIATYLNKNAFVSLWYDLIRSKTPFPQDLTLSLWKESIDLLSGIDRVAALIDELELTIKI